jgi:hypothetical protein
MTFVRHLIAYLSKQTAYSQPSKKSFGHDSL